ncbi:MAG: hypothetical protein K8R90_02850 [Candidatus Cloacimonetes bacterium]|nr:hypothetical protein [Candidatus Cloacimonadota bacterium]
MNKRVTLHEDRVIKRFDDHEHFLREKRVYDAHPDFAPTLLSDNGSDMIIIERVPGIPLIECDTPDFHMAGGLLADLHMFQRHKEMALTMVDTNPRNFLQGSSRGWLIDFSHIALDYPEPDLIHFLLFWAANQPHDAFMHTCQVFIGAYRARLPLDPGRWLSALPAVIQRFDQRRQRYGKSEKYAGNDVLRNRTFLEHSAQQLLRP